MPPRAAMMLARRAASTTTTASPAAPSGGMLKGITKKAWFWPAVGAMGAFDVWYFAVRETKTEQ
ncbi:hypothetical protein DFJ74DRAFT_768372 [Hyaloraphidium curvatum]|nr:hypothetical protein DFJ74DRAFT_768372 [Hyaloraphidium curvatum]